MEIGRSKWTIKVLQLTLLASALDKNLSTTRILNVAKEWFSSKSRLIWLLLDFQRFHSWPAVLGSNPVAVQIEALMSAHDSRKRGH